MTLMDYVQILILLMVLLRLLKPVYARWLPRRWRKLMLRIIPPHALKHEGTWRRKPSESDKS